MRTAPARVEVLHAGEAERRQRRVAGALYAAGCRTGDRVAFALPSSADLLCALLGATRIGVIPVLLNPTLVESERDELLGDARARLAVLGRHALARLLDGSQAELSPWPLTRAMHYTSGTTGRPKGVSVGIWDEATARAVFDDEADLWSFSSQDRHLTCSPLHHTVSARFAGGTLLRGGSVVLLNRFDAATALSALRVHRPTTTFLAPTHLQRLLELPGLAGAEQFTSLRLLVHAGSSCPPSLKRAVMARVGPDVLWEFYGSTEGQFTVCSPSEWLARPGTVGRARPGRRLEVRSLAAGESAAAHRGGAASHPDGAAADPADPADPARLVRRHQVGTIWCTPPPFARFSYWGDPDATASAWDGGAFTVGDLGHLDDAGYLFLSGRRDDLIITGGVNVYPAEVEAALTTVPGVREVAVFGLDDHQWGQRVCAAVVAGTSVTTGDLEEAARRRLAPFKRPKEYFRAAELPHTSTGKLLRRAVAAHLGQADGVLPGPSRDAGAPPAGSSAG